MSPISEPIAVSIANLRARRYTVRELYRGNKDAYALARMVSGRAEWWDGQRVWATAPGVVQLKQPGDCHRDVRRDGPVTFHIVTFDASLIDAACDGTRPSRSSRQLDPADPAAAPYHRLHDAIDRGADALALDVAVSEAARAFARELTAVPLDERSPAWRRPVRRAVELLRAQLAEPLRLDEIAAHAGLDKFHLCRAFRSQVGIPPHAYLIRLRISRAKELLAAGLRPSDIAAAVGFYDQSQLHRHFRRLVGTTPARYARYVRE